MTRRENINSAGPSVEALLGLPRHNGGYRFTRRSEEQAARIDSMADWAPRYSITEEKSFGPLDRVSENVIQKRIISFIKRHAERMASVLDMSLEEYVASMPEIPDHVDPENPAFHPFLVDPRLNSGAFDVRTTSFQTEQEIDRVFENNRQDKPRIEWGMYVPVEQIENVDSQDLESQGLRHANVQELMFAYEQHIRPARFDYLFAQASITQEGVARIATGDALEFGDCNVPFVFEPSERFSLVIKK